MSSASAALGPRQDSRDMTSIHWFRKARVVAAVAAPKLTASFFVGLTCLSYLQGLRLHDNPSLLAAIDGSTNCHPLFILDPWFLTPERCEKNALSAGPRRALPAIIASPLRSSSLRRAFRNKAACQSAYEKWRREHVTALSPQGGPPPHALPPGDAQRPRRVPQAEEQPPDRPPRYASTQLTLLVRHWTE